MSSEDTTANRHLPERLAALVRAEVAKVSGEWHRMPNRDAYVHTMMEQAALRAAAALLAGRVVVDLPEPDDGDGDQRTWHLGSDEQHQPRIRSFLDFRSRPAVELIAGSYLSPNDARNVAAALLAAAGAAERLSGEVRNGQ